jgi:5'-nucleotidase (lipoprotein e(P4) family)
MYITACGLPGVLSAQAPAQAEHCKSHPPHLHANLWMQTSAEYQAVCRQTFNAALKEVKQAVKSAKRREGRPVGSGKKPLAVVADVDETILDNARFQSEMDAAVLANKTDIGYTPERWKQWELENAGEVGLVPGAGSFISEVEKLKVVMVYISNRLESLKGSTIQALAHNGIKTQGLQEDSELRLLLKKEMSNKQDRIRQVEAKYHVIAYLGDNLGDFPGETEQPKDVAEHLAARIKKVEAALELWGTRWFMLPNPIYGDWDRVLPKEATERIQLLKRAGKPAFVEAK